MTLLCLTRLEHAYLCDAHVCSDIPYVSINSRGPGEKISQQAEEKYRLVPHFELGRRVVFTPTCK